MLKVRPSKSTVNSIPGKQPSGTTTSTEVGGASEELPSPPPGGAGISKSMASPAAQPSGHMTESVWPSYSIINSLPSYTPSGTVTVTMVVAMISRRWGLERQARGGGKYENSNIA
jgi:hypothetical protein